MTRPDRAERTQLASQGVQFDSADDSDHAARGEIIVHHSSFHFVTITGVVQVILLKIKGPCRRSIY
jgi:hypothetical protein